ncbi:hypothetical protein Q3C01_23955 [Bradyrhizobium sp. UFLA05-109]
MSTTAIELRRETYIAPAIVTLGVLFAVFYRNPLLLTDPQMFSEDLFIYFNEDRLFGADALVRPYAGYLQICCRIIAFVTGFFPARYAAELYATFFVGTIFATAAVIYASPIFTGWGKVLAALALVYSPTGSETLFGMPYTQWIMAPVAGLALYESPASKGRMVVLLGYFALIGLSSPMVILAAPFVLWKTFSERTRYALWLCAITALCVAVQLHGIITRSAANPADGTVVERAFAASSIFYSWLTGPHYPGFWTALAISLPTFVLAAWYLWDNRTERAIIYLVGYGGLALIAGCLQVDASLHANQFLFGARYFYPPIVLFVLALIAIEQKTERGFMTLPIAAVSLGLIYAARVTNMNVHFTNRNWIETAECVEHSADCITGLNPGNTGSVRVPSDAELKTMSSHERVAFRNSERTP